MFDLSVENNFKIDVSKNYKKIINNYNANNKINDDLFRKVYEKVNTKISKIKRCIKCLVPTSYPKIKFDNNGVCIFCNSNFYGKERKI